MGIICGRCGWGRRWQNLAFQGAEGIVEILFGEVRVDFKESGADITPEGVALDCVCDVGFLFSVFVFEGWSEECEGVFSDLFACEVGGWAGWVAGVRWEVGVVPVFELGATGEAVVVVGV